MGSVQTAFWVVAMLVALASAFDFMNGFHDAANAIATVVSTGVLKPQRAVIFAAFFNVLAIAIFQLHVAATVGKGIVMPGVVHHHVGLDIHHPGVGLCRGCGVLVELGVVRLIQLLVAGAVSA